MTIINGIEIDNIKYIENDIKNALKRNKPIEDKLNMIIVISNPCLYARRYILAREFIKRIENDEPNINLFIVELAYNIPGKRNQEFLVTDSSNKNHLQIRTSSAPLWIKENLMNIGVKKLLPKNWKAVAFCDADIEFENSHFATDTLKLLNGTRDIVHLHSHCSDLDKNEIPMNIFTSFGFQYSNKLKYSNKGGIHFWHPGFNVAMTRKAYEKLNGLYEVSILGAGDHNLFLSLIGNAVKSINESVSDGYKKSILEFGERCKDLKLGYVPGMIKHYFHGSKINRKYAERWKILVKHQYDPNVHIIKSENGLLLPSDACPKELLDDIMKYFQERNEDE